ncbi:MAG TPA: hypothetical protein EYQ61_02070 [Dehalococcoidia bacterium]|nr:hypothetical protein [Dehalococcoidia bacterium]HIK90275.1 hypothetical protein [Dehalococcoidia bacterium]
MITIIINACTTTNIFCRPNCPPGRRTKPENRIHFKSITEAEQNGFRACLVCRPTRPADGHDWRPKSER